MSQVHDMLYSSYLGRGVFSCTDFDKGDFLLEYRGDLISREECERRQRIYHDALKVFMYEFRFNGKFLWYVQILYTWGRCGSYLHGYLALMIRAHVHQASQSRKSLLLQFLNGQKLQNDAILALFS